jgi:hypothetical protein
VIGRLATEITKQSAPSGESGDEGVRSQEDLRKKKREDSKTKSENLFQNRKLSQTKNQRK